MTEAALLSYGLAAVLLLAAVAIVHFSHRSALRQKIDSRLRGFGAPVSDAAEIATTGSSWWEQTLWRAGIEARPWQIPAGLVIVAAAGLAGWAFRGPAGAGFVVPSLAVGLYVMLVFKSRKRMDLMLAQLPLFLDQVLRSLGTGRSMDGALALATAEAKAPLREVMDRVERTTTLGADLGDTLKHCAGVYQLKELYLLALSVSLSRAYGSSARDLLQSIVVMVHRQEHARRELRAMTGETRASAWVLGLLPAIMAGYMIAMNPGYLEGMWRDPTGQVVLLVAIALQAGGSFVLWRMVKSI